MLQVLLHNPLFPSDGCLLFESLNLIVEPLILVSLQADVLFLLVALLLEHTHFFSEGLHLVDKHFLVVLPGVEIVFHVSLFSLHPRSVCIRGRDLCLERMDLRDQILVFVAEDI